MRSPMPLEPHPDSHELDDWAVYGPRDPQIASLVSRLAVLCGLRVREIETMLISALVERMDQGKQKRDTFGV